MIVDWSHIDWMSIQSVNTIDCQAEIWSMYEFRIKNEMIIFSMYDWYLRYIPQLSIPHQLIIMVCILTKSTHSHNGDNKLAVILTVWLIIVLNVGLTVGNLLSIWYSIWCDIKLYQIKYYYRTRSYIMYLMQYQHCINTITRL